MINFDWIASYLVPVWGCKSDFLANGKYRIMSFLASDEDSLTLIYQALNTTTQKNVTIKEFNPKEFAHRAWDGGSLLSTYRDYLDAEKERYAKSAAKLLSASRVPGIVWVKDVFYQNNLAYVVTDFIGKRLSLPRTLKDAVSEGTLNAENAFCLLSPVMKALAIVHRQGIFHGSICPESIFIDEKGQTQLWNLGNSGVSFFTPPVEPDLDWPIIGAYAIRPPELFWNGNGYVGQLGPWTDVHSMCELFHYCLTGKIVPPTWAGGAACELEQPYPFSRAIDVSDQLSPAIHSVLQCGLNYDYRERIQSMDELLEKLHAAIYGNG